MFSNASYPLPADHYAHHLVSRLQDATDHFTQIKSDLKRRQRDLYDSHARHITISDGKIVYVCKDHVPSHTGLATRFVRNFDGPFLVLGHPYGRSDLLTLRHVATNNDLPHPINVTPPCSKGLLQTAFLLNKKHLTCCTFAQEVGSGKPSNLNFTE